MSKSTSTRQNQTSQWALHSGSSQRFYNPVSKKSVKLSADNISTTEKPEFVYTITEYDKSGKSVDEWKFEGLKQARVKFKEIKKAITINISGGLY